MDRVERNIEEMGRQHREIMGEIKALHVNIESLHDSVGQLYATARKDGENIQALARIAESHERRSTDIEGGSA